MSGTTSGVDALVSGSDLMLAFFQGKTIDFHLTWNDGGNPVDLTGYAARFQARDTSEALIVDLSTLNGGLIIDGPAGKITFAMSAADSALLPIVSGAHELEVESPSGKVSRLFSGRFSVIKEVAR